MVGVTGIPLIRTTTQVSLAYDTSSYSLAYDTSSYASPNIRVTPDFNRRPVAVSVTRDTMPKDLRSATGADDRSIWINGRTPFMDDLPLHLPVAVDGQRPAGTRLDLTPARFQSPSS